MAFLISNICIVHCLIYFDQSFIFIASLFCFEKNEHQLDMKKFFVDLIINDDWILSLLVVYCFVHISWLAGACLTM